MGGGGKIGWKGNFEVTLEAWRNGDMELFGTLGTGPEQVLAGFLLQGPPEKDPLTRYGVPALGFFYWAYLLPKQPWSQCEPTSFFFNRVDPIGGSAKKYQDTLHEQQRIMQQVNASRMYPFNVDSSTRFPLATWRAVAPCVCWQHVRQ